MKNHILLLLLSLLLLNQSCRAPMAGMPPESAVLYKPFIVVSGTLTDLNTNQTSTLPISSHYQIILNFAEDNLYKYLMFNDKYYEISKISTIYDKNKEEGDYMAKFIDYTLIIKNEGDIVMSWITHSHGSLHIILTVPNKYKYDLICKEYYKEFRFEHTVPDTISNNKYYLSKLERIPKTGEAKIEEFEQKDNIFALTLNKDKTAELIINNESLPILPLTTKKMRWENSFNVLFLDNAAFYAPIHGRSFCVFVPELQYITEDTIYNMHLMPAL